MERTTPSFLRNSLSSYAVFSVNLLLRLVLYRTVMSQLGPELFGTWGILQSALLIPLFFQQAFYNAVLLTTAREKEKANRIGEVLALVLFFGGLVALLVFLFARELTFFFRISEPNRAMMILAFRLSALIFFLHSIAEVFLHLLQGIGRFDLSALLTSCTSLGNSLCAVLLLYRGFQILTLLVIDATTFFLLAAAAFLTCRKMIGQRLFIFSFQVTRVITLLRESAGQLLLAFSGKMLWELDPLLIPRFFGVATMAPYWMGRKLPYTWNDLVWWSGTPAVTEAVKASETSEMRLMRIHWLQISLALPAAALLWTFAPSIIRLWMGTEDPSAFRIMRILALAGAIDFLPSTYVFFLMVHRKVFRIIRITLLAAFVKILLSVAACLIRDLTSLILATAAGALVFAGAFFVSFSKESKLPFAGMLKPVLAPAAAIGIGMVAFHFANEPTTLYELLFMSLLFAIVVYFLEFLFLRAFFPKISKELAQEFKPLRNLISNKQAQEISSRKDSP